MTHRDSKAARLINTFLLTTVSMLAISGASRAQSPVTPPGSGTSANPYLISQLGHLVWMGDTAAGSSGKYYTMAADIDASATATWNDAGTSTDVLEGFKPIGAYSYPDTTSFRGIFDGNGHTITGLVINRLTTSRVGLFGCIGQNWQVRNLSIIRCEITGDSHVGGLVGHNYYGTVSNCHVTGSITGSSYTGGLIGWTTSGTVSNCSTAGKTTGAGGSIGGLVGYNDAATISNCFATGSVKGSACVGGLIGDSNGSFSNCYATGATTGDDYVGGLVGYCRSGVLSCYATGAVAGATYVGGLVGYRALGTVSNSYWNMETSGQSTSAGGTGKTTAEMKQQVTFAGWDFTALWGIAEETSYPYLLYSPPPFKLMVSTAGPGHVTIDPPSTDGTYAPGTAVTLTATPSEADDVFVGWLGAEPSGSPTATALMDSHRSVTAMFRREIQISTLADLAKIGNDPDFPLEHVLYILMADIDASPTAGWNDAGTDTTVLEGFKPIGTDTRPFAGIFDGNGHTITGLVINRQSTDRVGLFGYVCKGGEVRNLGMLGNSVAGAGYVGVLVGHNERGSVSNCYATGAVTGTGYVGGLIGRSYAGTVSGCYATGTAKGSSAGGLIGSSSGGMVSNCYATGMVTGDTAGGLIGTNSYKVSDCHATGEVVGTSSVGGLIGYNSGPVSSCYGTGAVTGTGDAVGGLVGYNAGGVSSCCATGTVKGAQQVGGLIGLISSGMASNSFATGAVEGNYYVGGLVGDNYKGTVSYCYATGTVTGVGSWVGGLVGGSSGGKVSNSFATGAVAGQYTVGGLIGYQSDTSATVSNCYAVGAISGAVNVGGLVGYKAAGTVSSSYWDTETSGLSTSAGGIGKTTTEMKQQATFAGWDFATIWNISAGITYPYLQYSPPPFKLAVTIAGPGYVTIDPPSMDGTYAPGTMVTLTATPSEANAVLIGWEGAEPSESPTATVIMDIHRSVRVTFQHVIDINSLADLTKIGNDPAYPLEDVKYILTSDIDASQTATWNDEGTDTDVLEGFEPIGSFASRFSGIFDGNGHAITGLTINRPGADYVGLFGLVGRSGQVRNLGIVGGAVMGNNCVGGLTGYSYYCTVSNCFATGAVAGTGNSIGGLVGNQNGTPSTVSNCYATGAVTGNSYVGGLVGYTYNGKVSYCYSAGAVTGTGNNIGGLVGYKSANTVTNSYWDTQTSGQSTSAGGTGKTTAQMKQQATFAGWDFANIWGIVESMTYPYLRNMAADSDGDGVIDQIDACPATVPGATVDVLGCPPVISGDFNHDGDVDSADLDAFQGCAAGPAVPYPDGCDAADFDHDNDVDQSDFGILQRCSSGEGIPAEPGCAE